MDARGKLTRTLSRLLREEDGPSATEYAILLALLVLVAMVAIRGIGERMFAIYQAINATMPT